MAPEAVKSQSKLEVSGSYVGCYVTVKSDSGRRGQCANANARSAMDCYLTISAAAQQAGVTTYTDGWEQNGRVPFVMSGGYIENCSGPYVGPR
jgi:hypothetical protein